MAQLLEFVITTFTAAVAVPGVAETVVVTSPAISPPIDSKQLVIEGWCTFTSGTGVTGYLARIRRGTTAGGTLIGNADTIALAASTTALVFAIVLDGPGIVAGVQYVLTLQQVAATGAGSALDGGISVTSF